MTSGQKQIEMKTRRENDIDWRCLATQWEPQEEGMMSTAASFPQYETKV
jgi:hypothetical protein